MIIHVFFGNNYTKECDAMSTLITTLSDFISTYQEYRSDTEISHMLGIDVETIRNLKNSLRKNKAQDLSHAEISFEK
jgi:hypothetical protein